MAVMIWGAGAPAKTKNSVHRKVNIFFREKVRPFPHLAKRINTKTESEEDDYGTDKKEWSEINEDWRLCVWQMEGKSTARI